MPDPIDPIDAAAANLTAAAKALRAATKKENTVSGNLQEAKQALAAAKADFDQKALAFQTAMSQSSLVEVLKVLKAT